MCPRLPRQNRRRVAAAARSCDRHKLDCRLRCRMCCPSCVSPFPACLQSSCSVGAQHSLFPSPTCTIIERSRAPHDGFESPQHTLVETFWRNNENGNHFPRNTSMAQQAIHTGTGTQRRRSCAQRREVDRSERVCQRAAGGLGATAASAAPANETQASKITHACENATACQHMNAKQTSHEPQPTRSVRPRPQTITNVQTNSSAKTVQTAAGRGGVRGGQRGSVGEAAGI